MTDSRYRLTQTGGTAHWESLLQWNTGSHFIFLRTAQLIYLLFKDKGQLGFNVLFVWALI